MTIPAQACLMRIYTQERAQGEHRALFEEIVTRARDTGLARATVLRGVMGFGASSVIHNAGILDLSSNLPLVIELVDAEDKLRAFLADLPNRDAIGLVTLGKVEMLHQATG